MREDASARLDAFRQDRGGVRAGIVLLSLLALGFVIVAIYAMVMPPVKLPTSPEANDCVETSAPRSADASGEQPTRIDVEVDQESTSPDTSETGVVEAKRVLEFSAPPVNAGAPGMLPGTGAVPAPQRKNFAPEAGEAFNDPKTRREVGRRIGRVVGWWSYD